MEVKDSSFFNLLMNTTPMHRIPAAMIRAMKTTAANASSVNTSRAVNTILRMQPIPYVNGTS